MPAYVAVILAAAVLGILMTAVVVRYRRKRRYPLEIDLMEGHDFEYYCAELLRQQGFLEVEVTRGSGDYGIDILAEKDGVTYAIQCKRYTAPWG